MNYSIKNRQNEDFTDITNDDLEMQEKGGKKGGGGGGGGDPSISAGEEKKDEVLGDFFEAVAKIKESIDSIERNTTLLAEKSTAKTSAVNSGKGQGKKRCHIHHFR